MADFSLSTVADLFKRKYTKLSDNVYNSANVTNGRVKKDHGFTGSALYQAVPLGFAGGVGGPDSGTATLPTANPATYDQAVISAVAMYSIVSIDRESIKASANDAGSFVRGLKEVVKKGVEAFARNDSRAMYGNADGALGTIASVAGGASPFTLTFAAGYNEANFEESDYVTWTGATTTLAGSPSGGAVTAASATKPIVLLSNCSSCSSRVAPCPPWLCST